MNRIALEQNYTVLATGHNLDDEAFRAAGKHPSTGCPLTWSARNRCWKLTARGPGAQGEASLPHVRAGDGGLLRC